MRWNWRYTGREFHPGSADLSWVKSSDQHHLLSLLGDAALFGSLQCQSKRRGAEVPGGRQWLCELELAKIGVAPYQDRMTRDQGRYRFCTAPYWITLWIVYSLVRVYDYVPNQTLRIRAQGLHADKTTSIQWPPWLIIAAISYLLVVVYDYCYTCCIIQ